MSDELDVNPEAPDAAPAAPEAAPAAPKADFAEHPVFVSVLEHVAQFAGAATARAEQILAELRELMNEHGL